MDEMRAVAGQLQTLLAGFSAGSIVAGSISAGSISVGKLPRHLGSILPPLDPEPEPAAAPAPDPIQRPKRRARVDVWI